ncbi:folylpolyglutamate synthase/dihydrofolate synthase family protein [Pedobacter sp. SYP-B3415]|uniref:bifunctional folylpolyglutamate synthase/dihydrofolate synthase n=1 Tax=Pedobacter sp. SYP-B3415 TaxID=2496641 RepID=UPI00101D5021|nr:folylpolyglutamate synthase/dihydrofolate synthase family protein [Pedobacter sp. SYP-B3415]
MNYDQTLEYLYRRLPMFTRVGAAAIKKGLGNILALCEALGNPQQTFRSIHIAGTNGKGSCSHMMASILQEAGYRTGLYTSPHLKDFRERIRVNGKMIARQDVVDFIEQNRQLIEELEPSFFEVTVALAFRHFAQSGVEIAVVEVGLGGRLDSTNIIQPVLSVITNISMDHVALLGNTLPLIAAEKAGIIKKGIPVVIGETQAETTAVFLQKAADMQAPIYFADQMLSTFGVSRQQDRLKLSVRRDLADIYPELTCDLSGTYQEKNIRTIIAATEVLRQSALCELHEQSIRNGLNAVKSNTGLQGRWQTLSKEPLVICDTGHNEAGIREVLQNISDTPYENLHMVFGMVSDKDVTGVLSMLPKHAKYYFCSPKLERALAAEMLQQLAALQGLEGEVFESVTKARAAAEQSAARNDLIFIGGSTFVVAEAI